jgi:putative endonuclease
MPPSDSRRPGERPHRARCAEARDLGRVGEQLACEHLERLGFRVLARNVRTRGGEIDVIAFDGLTLAFVEVKSSRAATRGTGTGEPPTPLERLHGAQRARLRRLAAAWLCEPGRRRPRAREVRLDAIGVIVDEHGQLLRLEHVEGAW